MKLVVKRIDEEALQEILKARAPRLRNYLAKRIPTMLRDVISAEDVLQEVWIAAFRGLPRFRPDGKDAADRWLTTIAQRTLLNTIKAAGCLKRGGRHGKVQGDADRVSSMLDLFVRIASPCRTPSSEAAVVEAVDAIQIALASLPEARRLVISMAYLEGRSLGAIAKATNKTRAAVKSLLYHGKRQLKEHLGSAARFLSDAPSSEEALPA